MGKYRITAARPKNAANHLNSEFKVYEWKTKNDKLSWWPIGWKTIYDISALVKAGDEVRTGKVEGTSMKDGDADELELRIAHNGTKFKISEMPDS